MKKQRGKDRFPNYDPVDLQNIVTFGTQVWIAKDTKSLIIVFPCGNELHFEPV